MLQVLNALLGRSMPVLTPVSVFIGLLLSEYLQSLTDWVPWIFALITFSGSLKLSFKTFGHSMIYTKTIFITLLVLHVIGPLWAWTVGHLLFAGDPGTVTGLILASVIPTGITSIIWVTMYNGNQSVTLSIILLDTLLSPIVVPHSMHLLARESVAIDTSGLMIGLLWMIVIPTVVGMMLNQTVKHSCTVKLADTLAPFSKLSLPFIIAVNSSTLGSYINTFDWELAKIVGAILFISMSGFLFCWLLGYLFHENKKNTIAVIFTGGMRNISSGVVIAVSYFSPQVALPVVMGMLFQQTLAAVNGHVILHRRDRLIQHSKSKQTS